MPPQDPEFSTSVARNGYKRRHPGRVDCELATIVTQAVFRFFHRRIFQRRIT
jgi:hypothetical protein